ncbi:hypothetical protein FEM48_Zijuj03G0069500 [Ziziphus jujuba var. spinosa]|uniref:Uncharacterized protein n=1 Tax=Ziziphus jujuba var. spinosa TaxID=714518 RepID=A0A978VNU5_ZIZJJ|nr:hypothetical protein FEM48_Zijuj03G0069500 [Ziziphus jujuba var. spinosa]
MGIPFTLRTTRIQGTGSYMTCFFAPDHKPETTLTVEFDWRTGFSAEDWSNVAKKGSVENSFETVLDAQRPFSERKKCRGLTNQLAPR